MKINKRLQKFKYIVGIDEVGRGPLAGPVAVCAFKMPVDLDMRSFGKIMDSKKLSPEKREVIFGRLSKMKKGGQVEYAVRYESARNIDRGGISVMIKKCIAKALSEINAKPEQCLVLLDGGLKAPESYKNQKTIIKGDEKERVIAFASIVAKVSRDRRMVLLAKKYKKYNFHIHKGYGTKAHCDAIRRHGLCAEHRKSFCRSILCSSHGT